MTKISSASKASSGRPAKSIGKSAQGKGFHVGAAGAASVHASSGAAAATQTPPVETLSALIALQSEGGGRAKTIAAAQRSLALLDRIQDGILAGRIQISDLEALSNAADAKAAAADDDETLAAIYNDISLRARVELAKLGR